MTDKELIERLKWLKELKGTSLKYIKRNINKIVWKKN